MKPVRILTVTAMFSAVGFLMLWLGSMLEVLDLITVMAASLLVVFAVIEFRGAWPFLLYGVTALLSLLLLPNRFVGVEYALFGGLYPIVKYYWEKLPRLFSGIGKLFYANLAGAALYLLGTKVFGLQLSHGGWYPVLLFLLINVTFVLYDILLTRLIIRYFRTIRPRIGRLLK